MYELPPKDIFGLGKVEEMKTKNEKKTWTVKTDRIEAHLVTEFPALPSSEQQINGILPMLDMPFSYLMIGPPGGPLARIESHDAELLSVMLDHVLRSGARYLPGAAPPPRAVLP